MHDTLEITAWPGFYDQNRAHDPAWVRSYLEAGATRLVVSPPLHGDDGLLGPRGLEALRDYIARYREDVLDKAVVAGK